ncbi:MAG: hypothetical protein QOI26_513 [Pseudonocardiales bacterium]|nr:hypothetical protein [Pseudonocardiales bacterium]
MTADANLAELPTESARDDPDPRYRALHELGPIALRRLFQSFANLAAGQPVGAGSRILHGMGSVPSTPS